MTLLKNNKIFILLFTIFFFFLVYKIGSASINNDAQFWYTRTQNFVSAVKRNDWEETFQNPKPGVTVMWVSGYSLDTLLSLYDKLFGFTPSIYEHKTFYLVHSAVILPLIIFTLISIFIFYFIGKHLVRPQVVLLSLLVLVTQPLYVGLARNFHSDASVTAFMTVSVLFLFYYLLKNTKILFLIVSSLSAGLALLSKSSAVFLIPFVLLCFAVHSIYFRKSLSFYFKSVSIWLVVLFVTFYIFFPAMWVYPKAVLTWVFIEEGRELLLKGRDGINPFLYYLRPLFKTLTPVYFISFVLGLFCFVKDFKRFEKKEKFFYVGILLYVFFFLLQMSLIKQKMDRYILPLFPLGSFIAGYGLFQIYTNLKNKAHKGIFLFIVIVFSFAPILYYFPNYLLFPSQPGKDQFGCSLCSDIGSYLNSKENPADLKIVFSSKKLHKLQPHVLGKVYSTDETLPNNWSAEYYVMENNQIPPEEFKHCALEKTISFRNVDYWKILSCKN